MGLTAVEIQQVTGLQLAGDAGGRKGDAAFEALDLIAPRVEWVEIAFPRGMTSLMTSRPSDLTRTVVLAEASAGPSGRTSATPPGWWCRSP